MTAGRSRGRSSQADGGLRKRQAIPPTLTSVGYMSGARTLCAGPADSLTGFARYREVYLRARHRWDVRVSLRHCWAAYRYGVVLSGSPQKPGYEQVRER